MRGAAPMVLVAALVLAPVASAAEPFDWKMSPRLERSDGKPLEYANTAGEVRGGPYKVELAANPDVCGRAGATFTWSTPEGDLAEPSVTCMLRHSFGSEGAYDVTLTVRDPEREEKFTRTVVVQDWLVASIGDSVGSGEGNPDVAATFGRARWQSPQCHRSSRAASARAALALENADPHTSVTFLHLACSGAEIDPGLLTGYRGIDPGPLLPPQLAELSQVRGATGREFDAVIVNVGANDVLFGPVASFCLRKNDCVGKPFRGEPTTREAVRARLMELPG